MKDTGDAGGFDDADLSNRLVRRGYKLVYVPQSVIIHYKGKTNQMVDKKKCRVNLNQHYYSIKWEAFFRKRYDL